MTVIPLSIDRVKTRSENIRLGVIFLTLVVAIPMLLGWLAARTYVALRFLIAAFIEGWENGLSNGAVRKG